MAAERGPVDAASAVVHEKLGVALEAAMGPGMAELMHLDPSTSESAKRGDPVVDSTIAAALAPVAEEAWAEEVVPPLVRAIWFHTWRFTTHALQHVGWHMFHRASAIPKPDPWAPWVGMLRLGLWPLSDDGEALHVYEPRPRGE